MLNKLKKPNQKGFTIIEVMIVLAIAGLILLIVFLAIPALQRNSRNTQRKNDVSALLAAISEYSNNNNGALPTTCSGTTTVQIGTAATGSQANVGYYTTGCDTATTTQGRVQLLTAFAATGPFSTAGNDRVVIVPAATCTGNAAAAGSARSFVAVYEVENGAGTYAPACQAS